MTARVADARLDRSIRRSSIIRDLGEVREAVATRLGAIAERATRELNLPPLATGSLELELAAHGDGAYYREHIDTATGNPGSTTARALAGVCYFYRQPKAFSGGELRIHAIAPAGAGARLFADIVPDCGLLLLFPAWAPHEVRPVNVPSGAFLDSRFAINCWFHHQWDGAMRR